MRPGPAVALVVALAAALSWAGTAAAAGTGSDYSRLTLSLGVARADLPGFFKLTAVVYAAFVLSLGSYVVERLESPHALGPQLGLLAAALFAAAVNLRTASEALSYAHGLTLVDAIHIVVLLSILIAAAASLCCDGRTRQG